MAAEDMSAKYLDKANKFYLIGLKNIKTPLNMLGTSVVINRPKDNSKWKLVFGGTYSSDATLENDYETFTTKLIMNLNDLRDVWLRNRDTIEVYSNEDNLNVGDEVQYTREGLTYRFKVIQKQGFSEASKGLFVYILSSIIETKDML